MRNRRTYIKMDLSPLKKFFPLVICIIFFTCSYYNFRKFNSIYNEFYFKNIDNLKSISKFKVQWKEFGIALRLRKYFSSIELEDALSLFLCSPPPTYFVSALTDSLNSKVEIKDCGGDLGIQKAVEYFNQIEARRLVLAYPEKKIVFHSAKENSPLSKVGCLYLVEENFYMMTCDDL